MPDRDLIELFVDPLTELRVPYMVSGSVAAMLYGEPRVTHDIDLVVLLRSNHVALLELAYPADQFYLPPREVIEVELARERRGHFNVIHSETGLKADFYIANRDELHVWALQRPREYQAGSGSIRLAPPEYVIIRKLEYYREGGSEKHLRDIRAMLTVSAEILDDSALDDWIRRRRLAIEWEVVTSQEGPDATVSSQGPV